MSISLALIPGAILLSVILFEKDYKYLIETNESIENIELATNYTDKNLLMETLKEYGVKIISENGDNIKCFIECSILEFYKIENQYKVKIINSNNGNLTYRHLKEIDGEYKRNLQEQVYVNTKENIKLEGMEILNEEILDDNSIVITINC